MGSQATVKGWHLRVIRVMSGFPTMDEMASAMHTSRQTLGVWESRDEIDGRVAGIYKQFLHVDVYKMAARLDSILTSELLLTFADWQRDRSIG